MSVKMDNKLYARTTAGWHAIAEKRAHAFAAMVSATMLRAREVKP